MWETKKSLSPLVFLLFCLLVEDVKCLSSIKKSPSNYNVKKNVPIVIVPGFGNDSFDYVAPLGQPEEVGFVSCLARRGLDNVKIVPIKRWEWVKVAGGFTDINFYRNCALPTGNGYGWYVKRIQQTINEAYEECGSDEKVIIMGHSAGGWLARAAMGDGTCFPTNDDDDELTVRACDRIQCLVTLGAVHKPPKDVGSCVTRGALSYTDETYPGAFLQKDGISYISVGGNAITGNNEEVETTTTNNDDDEKKQTNKRSPEQVAFVSYEAVASEGTLTGDGVVPLDWSMLEGSTQLRLDDVIHSINEAGTTNPTDRWYGAEKSIDLWLPTVLQETGLQKSADTKISNFLPTFPKWFPQLQTTE